MRHLHTLPWDVPVAQSFIRLMGDRFITLGPMQSGRNFAYDIFKFIIVYVKLCILIKIPLKYIHKGAVNN